jgi:hypothetical protein
MPPRTAAHFRLRPSADVFHAHNRLAARRCCRHALSGNPHEGIGSYGTCGARTRSPPPNV